MISQLIFCGKEIYPEYLPSSSGLYHQTNYELVVGAVEQSDSHLAGVRRAPGLGLVLPYHGVSKVYVWKVACALFLCGPCLTAGVVKPSARTGSASITLSAT